MCDCNKISLKNAPTKCALIKRVTKLIDAVIECEEDDEAKHFLLSLLMFMETQGEGEDDENDGGSNTNATDISRAEKYTVLETDLQQSHFKLHTQSRPTKMRDKMVKIKGNEDEEQNRSLEQQPFTCLAPEVTVRRDFKVCGQIGEYFSTKNVQKKFLRSIGTGLISDNITFQIRPYLDDSNISGEMLINKKNEAAGDERLNKQKKNTASKVAKVHKLYPEMQAHPKIYRQLEQRGKTEHARAATYDDHIPLHHRARLVNLIGPKCMLDCFFEGVPVQALWDTGAQVSIINEEFRKTCFPHIETRSLNELLNEGKPFIVRAANQTDIPLSGWVELKFQIKPKSGSQAELLVPVLVSNEQGVGQPPIIGNNVIQQLVTEGMVQHPDVITEVPAACGPRQRVKGDPKDTVPVPYEPLKKSTHIFVQVQEPPQYLNPQPVACGPRQCVKADPKDTVPVPYHEPLEKSTHTILQVQGPVSPVPKCLHVNIFNGSDGTKVPVTVRSTDTIGKLQHKALQQRPELGAIPNLVYNGKPVLQHQTLSELQVKPGATFITYQKCHG
ncbi:hypothetical protein DPX16_21751 [Anabarilius grahami]|uniref:Ubiquitin-like domain-containing protein n=1 Tax=Anabarilius grahami TaxID=495550 RepID=A0A3N0YK96_ANAGA|nr:hypothetical protein DPX16_21751 [Anabarilius grahami]